MLEDEQMSFLGLRGLIVQALREGDQGMALAYAERAFKLRPQTPWVVHALFDMQAQSGQWRNAQETLETGVRRKVVTQDKGRANGDGGGDHARSAGSWLTGAQPLKSEGSQIRVGVSADQIAAGRPLLETLSGL